MNRDQIQGQWKQVLGKARELWGRLTDNEPEMLGGRRDQLAGKLQVRYGASVDASDKQLAELQRSASVTWFKNPVKD